MTLRNLMQLGAATFMIITVMILLGLLCSLIPA
jgi:hypothetical protein